MTIKVLVNGAFGRMGQLSVKAINDHPGLEVVGQTGRDYDLPRAIVDSKADVVLDFTHPEAVFANAVAILEAGARPVIGTSGLNKKQVESLQAQAQKLKRGGLIAPNFSLGAVLMMKCASEIVKYMPQVEIIEMHHDGKADSPSGTSMYAAEMLSNAAKEVNQPLKSYRDNIPGARGATYLNIPIHAVRLPGFLAHEKIIFGSKGESLTLSHDNIDRESFMPGVCLACEKVMELDHLIYGLEGVL